MRSMKKQSIPPKLGLILLLGSGLLIAIGLLAIWPQVAQKARLKEDIARAKAEILEQQEMHKVYGSLLKLQSVKTPEGLPEEIEWELSSEDITNIPAVMGKMAQESGVKVVEITPAPSSLERYDNAVMVSGVFSGQLEDLKVLLLDIGALSSFSHIEGVTLRERGLEVVLQLKVWFTLKR